MLKKKYPIILVIIIALLSSSIFFSTGTSTQIMSGSYAGTTFNDSRDFNVTYSEPANPSTFSISMQNSAGYNFTLTKAKLQEAINVIEQWQQNNIATDFTSSPYLETEHIQYLNEVMGIFNNPTSFDNLVQEVHALGNTSTPSIETITFGDESIIVTSVAE